MTAHRRRYVRISGVALTTLMAVSPAWAQNADPEQDPEVVGLDEGGDAGEGEGEVIVVTGSRIRTDPLDKQAPVLQLTSEEIARSGLTSVADLLQNLPVSGGALNTRFNSSGNFGFPPDGGGIGAGAAQADLRYLGSKRVLVLVDGVRWINGSSASGVAAAADLNTIPIGIIERIEVLEDGASPIYGSDAIAGVINIITRKDMDGALVNAYVGGFHHADGYTQQYDASWGKSDDKMSVIVSASIVDQQRVSAADRTISSTPTPGDPNCASGCSSGTPQGRFVLTDPNTGENLNLTINPGVGGVPIYDPTQPSMAGAERSDDFNFFDNIDRFNFAPYNLVVTPSRRVGVFSAVRYKVAPRVSFRGQALFNNRQSVNQAAPEPLFIGSDAGNGNRLDQISIHETNPYNPFGFTIDAATNRYFIGRRPLEAGPRIFEQNVNTWYVSGGLYGDVEVAGRRVFWDATVAYGVNRADQLKHGAFSSAKLEDALGPAFTDGDGRTYCGTPDRPILGCVPFNIFGGQGADGRGSITQEMLGYVTFVQHDVSEQTLVDVTGNVSVGLVPLPAGDLSVAAGVEHRRQSGFYEPDPVVVAGDSAGTPSQPTSGSYTVNEAYAEVRVPLVARMPGADLLDVNGAVRVSDYSTFGSEATFKAGARWRPIKDLMLRGSVGQGFRAPGIGELFGSDARFDQVLDDPCSDMLGLGANGTRAPDAVIDNCVAAGVPADGSYTQFNPQISVTTGGNSDLDAETSRSIVASLVYSPSWLLESPWVDRFDAELTYFDIELDGAIQATDAQVVLDGCYIAGDDEYCSRIGRTPSGVVNAFNNRLENIGGLITRGLSLNLTYTGPQTLYGRFRVTSQSSFLKDFIERLPAADGGFRKVFREGTEIGDPERAFPRLKSTLILDWFYDEWRASLTTRYSHSVREPCRDLVELGGCSDYDPVNDANSTNLLSPMVYNDAQVTWTPKVLDNAFDLTVGVNNLLNREPPICYSCSLNGFDATTYDVPGIFGYMSASYRMY
ncbi:TonB-dependent receptor plug domain-containing protein [Haliangium sp.]|uniref:TonB-dependent receptor plug domain-containing protein n=1 Tax=Haliangium sp. TaxID=2663208 RepID=UPI003D132ADC